MRARFLRGNDFAEILFIECAASSFIVVKERKITRLDTRRIIAVSALHAPVDTLHLDSLLLSV